MAEPETVLVEQKAPLLVRVLGLTVVLMLAGALLVWGWDLGTRLIGASSKPAPAVVIEHTPAPVAGSAAASAAAEAGLRPAGAAPSNPRAVAPAASGEGAGSDPAAASVPAPAPGASASPAPATSSVSADPGTAAENERLAADLALLESILPPVKPGAGLVIRGLQARMASASQLHYTILLGYGAKKGQPRFEGRLSIILQAKKDGKPLILEFPTKEGAERYQLTVEDYQRIDGTLDLPAGVQASELKVTLSGGKTSVSQTTLVKTSP